MKRSQRLLLLGVLLMGLFGTGWYLAGFLGNRAVATNGVLLDSPEPAADFSLHAADEQQVRLSDYRGKVVVLYFGYTFCPDVCPTTLAALAQARAELGPLADDVQVIMVTVDPERDTPERLRDYVQRFDPTFIGVTGPLEEIQDAATSFGVFFQKNEVSGASGYLVDHTATVTAVDREGRIRLLLPYELTSDQIADDLRVLLDE